MLGRRCNDDRRRAAERFEHTRSRTSPIDAVESDALHGHAVPSPDEVLLEPDLTLAGDDHACLDPVIAHREHARREPPRRSDLRGHVRERGALIEAMGAIEVGREVTIAEAEPGRASARRERTDIAVALQRVHGAPRLTDEAPARLRVDRPGERVRDGVEVGADVKAVQHDVVAGVDDRGDLGGGPHLHQPGQEARGAHAPGQHGDHPRALCIA